MTNLDGLLALHQSTYVTVDRAVAWEVAPAVYQAVGRAGEAVYGAVYRVVHPALDGAVFRAVKAALPHPALELYLHGMRRG